MPKFEYAPAPESRAIVTIEKSYGLFIDGAFTRPKATFPTINPADETVLAEVSQAGPKDVDKAVAAARRAYDGVWGRMSGAERSKYLFRIARILQERAREFAVLESLDNGKPIKETRDFDVPTAAAHFFYHAGWADKLEYAGLSTPGSAPARAHGVVGQIIPWNFPLLMLAWKVAPALATGNTVVLKPAETTPLSALLFAEVCQQAELPAGVVNIVTGDGRTGQALVEHPDVDKIAFTGSTEVGKTIARSIAGTAKKATLELGGKAAEHHLRRRPHRAGRRGHRRRHLLQPGPGLLRRVAPARAGERPRPGHRQAEADGSRRCASATRSTRTATSARSTRASSSTASRPSSTRASPRAPSAGARPARCRPRASGTPRRCSPASRRPTGSRRRRSSGRS